jgi:hypothetical protein
MPFETETIPSIAQRNGGGVTARRRHRYPAGVGAKERVDVLAIRAWILGHQPQHALSLCPRRKAQSEVHHEDHQR